MIEWISNPRNMLVYLGSPGVGKTYFCSALIPFIVDKFPSYRAYHERDFLRRIRSSMDQSGDYLETVKLLLDDVFVMIDDVGSSGVNDWRKEVLFEMIDQRYSSGLPTVITSNLNRKEIYEQLGSRFASRLLAKENMVLEVMNGFDFRQKDNG